MVRNRNGNFFLGRETCRPKPKCEECLLADICFYYATEVI
ncbi:hypothetical protein ACQ9BO_16985 [Flavobacterium sp. P21]